MTPKRVWALDKAASNSTGVTALAYKSCRAPDVSSQGQTKLDNLRCILFSVSGALWYVYSFFFFSNPFECTLRCMALYGTLQAASLRTVLLYSRFQNSRP